MLYLKQMINVKKLITGFLILAAAGGSAALIFSTTTGPATHNFAIASQTVSPDQLAINGNAFVNPPSAPDVVTNALDNAVNPSVTSSTEAELADPNNLTSVLSGSFLNALVSANPNGVQSDASGNVALAPPDNTAVLAELAKNPALKSLKIPNWDFEAATQPIAIATNDSPDAVTSYANALQDIFNRDFVQTNLMSMLSQNSDPSATSYVGEKIQSALQDIGGIQTPMAAVNFQKGLIKLLVYEKNMLALAGSASGDPVKTTLVFQAEKQKYNTALEDFKTELQKSPVAKSLSFGGGIQKEHRGALAFLDTIMGIKTAHAQWITFDPTVFGQILLEYANNIILQILKNTIIFAMQQTVLKWIQGSGVPRFIQNWGTTLANAYLQSGLSALDSQMSCINSSPFQTQVRFTLGAFYKPNNNNVCAVQFQTGLANNLSQFYNHFANGGWVSYGSIMQPDNNYYGSLFFTAQVVDNTARNQQQAVQAQAIANQGWNGSQQCNDGSDPTTGTHAYCEDGSAPDSSGGCKNGAPALLAPNNGQCADGSAPTVTSPGQVTGQVFNSAVDSGSKLVTAANDIAGLLTALLSSLLNSLATEAITAASGALH